MALTRESLTLKLNTLAVELQTARDEAKSASKLAALVQTKQMELKSDNERLTAELMNINRELALKHNADILRKDRDIQDIIAEHNNQLTEIKRVYKNLQSVQRIQFMQLIEKCSRDNAAELDIDSNLSSDTELSGQKGKKKEIPKKQLVKSSGESSEARKADSRNPPPGNNVEARVSAEFGSVLDAPVEFQDIFQENLLDLENSFDR